MNPKTLNLKCLKQQIIEEVEKINDYEIQFDDYTKYLKDLEFNIDNLFSILKGLQQC